MSCEKREEAIRQATEAVHSGNPFITRAQLRDLSDEALLDARALVHEEIRRRDPGPPDVAEVEEYRVLAEAAEEAREGDHQHDWQRGQT